MAYFARQVDHGDGGGVVRVIDVVQVPSGVPDAIAWLSMMFAHNRDAWVGDGSWFIPCDSGTQNGAKCQRGADMTDPNNFQNPVPPVRPPAYQVLTRQDFRAHAVKILGGNAIGTVKVQSYLDIAAANAGTQNADKLMRYALVAVRDNTTFTRDDADQIMQALGFSAQDRNAVTTAWPTV